MTQFDLHPVARLSDGSWPEIRDLDPDFKLKFACVGAAKCGTSWMDKGLKEHPQVRLPIGKETNYFTEQWPLRKYLSLNQTYYTESHHHWGMAWYQSLFIARKPGQILGEFTPAYLASTTAPKLLYEHNPDLKLIFSFRKPQDYLQSLFFHFSRSHNLPKTLEATIERAPEFRDGGLFHQHVAQYLKNFPREQMHFVLLEDLQNDPDGVFLPRCVSFSRSMIHTALNHSTRK